MSHTNTVRTAYAGRLFQVQIVHTHDEKGTQLEREIVRHPGAVLVIGKLDDQRLLMIRNQRIAVGGRLLEFPAGKLEKGEDPRDAAARELEEETGYQAQRIQKLGEFYTSPGFCDELMHVFAADGLVHVGQRLEAGEDILVEELAERSLTQMIADGQLRDGKSIAGFLMWQLAK